MRQLANRDRAQSGQAAQVLSSGVKCYTNDSWLRTFYKRSSLFLLVNVGF
jgi:hypothetical protein